MLAALFAALPFLEPFIAKLPTLQTMKWISGGVLLLTVAVVSGYAGWRWEAEAFDNYKTQAAAHELALQESYDRIGGDSAATYLAAVERDQAETQRQLDEMKYAPPIPAPPALPKGKRKPVPAAADPDARIIGVLRDAAAGGQK